MHLVNVFLMHCGSEISSWEDGLPQVLKYDHINHVCFIAILPATPGKRAKIQTMDII